MELSDALDFIRQRRQGVLTTLRANGRPQLSNIAYQVIETAEQAPTIAISVTDGRAKTANLRRDPRASLHVTRDDFYAYVVIDADVELLPATTDPADATAEALVDYYRSVRGDHPDWDEYRAAMVAERRLLLLLHPTHAYGTLGS